MLKKSSLLLLAILLLLFKAYPQCNNCTTSYSINSAIVASSDNQIICISGGDTYSIVSSFKNVTIKICAPNILVNSVKINTNALNNTIESFADNTVIGDLISEADTFAYIVHNIGGKLSGNITINGITKFQTTNGATLSIAHNLTPGKKIFFEVAESSTINTASITSNSGGQIIIGKHSTFNSTGQIILQNDGFILNNGNLTCNGDFTIQNGGNAITNFCGESIITINGKFIVNSGKLYNAGIIKATTIAINANAGPIYPNEGSQMIATAALETTNAPNVFSGDSIKAGECALFKIGSYGSWNNPLSSSSKIKYCGPAASVSQLGQATADCSCLSETKLCTPVCLPPTAVTITAPVTNVCDGGSTLLTANATGLKVGDSYSYNWYKTSVSPTNLIVSNINTNTLSVNSTGVYFVVVSNTLKPADCSTQNTIGFIFTVNPIPPQPSVAASGPLTFCDGGSVSLTATSAGFTGGTYTWSNGSTANPLIVKTSGNYTVVYTSSNNCTAPVSVSVAVTVNPIPPVPTIAASGPLTFCDGGSVSLTATSAGFTGGTYTWSNGSTANPLVVKTSGNYTVVYTSTNNCTAPVSAAVAVTVNQIPPQPSVAASGPLTFCDGGSVSLTATSAGFTGGTYTWSNGSTANPLLVKISGNYTVVYMSSNNCTAPVSASVAVTVNPIPPQASVAASGPLTFCDGGSVSLTATSAGFTGGTYTWSNGSTANPLIVKTSGNYTVVYTSSNNCTAPVSASVAVTVNPIPPQASVAASGPLTFCDGGSVSLTATSAGFTGGTYKWSNGSTANPLIVKTSGNYTVVYTSSNNCTAPVSASVAVTVNPIPPQPSVSASGPLTFCDGGSVSLTATSAGFTGGTYTWSNGSTANPLLVKISGNYTVVYMSSNNCSAPVSAEVVVTVNPIPPVPTIAASGPLTFCDGGSVSLTATSADFRGGTYTWSNGSTANPLLVKTSGNYTVVYTSSNNCTAPVSVSVAVTVNPIPPQPSVAVSGPLTFCDGGSVSLTATSAGFTGGTYMWSNGSTANPLLVKISGNYTVVYMSSNNCTAPVSAEVAVTVNPIPPQASVAASGPLTFCDGGSVSLTATSAGFTGGTYTWSNGSTANPLLVKTSGNYTVIYTSTNNCSAPVSASVAVTVNPIPPQPSVAASGPLTFCDGSSVSLTATSAGFTGGTYIWSNGSTDNPLVVKTSGNYTVVYTSSNNCSAPVSAEVVVTVNPIPPVPTIAASGPLTFCDGGSVSLTATSADFRGGTYTWSNGSTANPLIVKTSGNYTVIYTSTNNCSAPVSTAVSVTVNPIPPQPSVAASGSLTFCDGASVSLTATSAGFTGGTYIWSNGSTDNPLVVKISGNYTVVYTSSNNCTAPVSAEVVVTVNPIPPQPSVAASGPLTFCDGASVSLTATSAGFTGGTYTWSNGSTANPLIVKTSGNYPVIYTSTNNCSAPVSAAVSVTVNPIPPQPSVAASGPLTFCDGASVSLTATSAGFTGGTYTWSSGSTDNPLVVKISGNYTVVYTSSNNCSTPVSAEVVVTVNPIPPVPTIAASGPLTFCDGGSVSLTATSAGFTGGVFTWSNGSTENPLVVKKSGTYTVNYISTEKCAAPNNTSIAVTVNLIPPQPILVASGRTDICPGETVTMKAQISAGYMGTFEWFNGAVSLGLFTQLDISNPGDYSVQFKTNDGCISNQTVSFTIYARPFNSPVKLGSDKIVCNQFVDLSTTAPLNGMGNWSLYDSNIHFDSKADSINVRVSGLDDGNDYKFVYTVSGECGDDMSDTIIVHAGVPGFKIQSVEKPTDTLCIGVQRRVYVNTTPTIGDYIYHWKNASTNQEIKTTTNNLEINPIAKTTIYYVYVEDKTKPGCKTFADTIEVDAIDKQKLFFPNLVTPNGDGKNDQFKIVEENNYANKMFSEGTYLEIVNRWGNRIYQANNYDGTWSAENTEDGMYYYYVKTGCGQEVHKGWLQILGNEH
jgi:gliding motility-associated-like protein